MIVKDRKTILVTGAAGFVGSAFARLALTARYKVLIVDALTYAGHMENIQDILSPDACQFSRVDLRDFAQTRAVFKKYGDQHSISGVIHFASESHVDNSIQGPRGFVETNVMGTFNLLECAREYWAALPLDQQSRFRFLNVSTDEVFGALGKSGQFNESSSYAPNSPYSASKAASDHLVRAWHHTYGLPTLVTNCSNNYGPRQFPEKLIPRMIMCALEGQPLPVYGKGENIRDWIHVEDHCRGVLAAYEKGLPGATYCFGGRSERNNLDVVKKICAHLDRLAPRPQGESYSQLIQFVPDRLGHDFRYAIDDSFAAKELGFINQYPDFEVGLEQTVAWYLKNMSWVRAVRTKKVKDT